MGTLDSLVELQCKLDEARRARNRGGRETKNRNRLPEGTQRRASKPDRLSSGRGVPSSGHSYDA